MYFPLRHYLHGALISFVFNRNVSSDLTGPFKSYFQVFWNFRLGLGDHLKSVLGFIVTFTLI